jgi:hypothetical protein
MSVEVNKRTLEFPCMNLDNKSDNAAKSHEDLLEVNSNEGSSILQPRFNDIYLNESLDQDEGVALVY